LSICILTAVPLLLKIKARDKVLFGDCLAVIFPVLVWNVLLLNSVGAQSLSNIVEVYVVAIVTVSYFVFRFKNINFSIMSKIIWQIGLIIFPILLRIFVPSLPE
jgi:hypothetical protein